LSALSIIVGSIRTKEAKALKAEVREMEYKKNKRVIMLCRMPGNQKGNDSRQQREKERKFKPICDVDQQDHIAQVEEKRAESK